MKVWKSRCVQYLFNSLEIILYSLTAFVPHLLLSLIYFCSYFVCSLDIHLACQPQHVQSVNVLMHSRKQKQTNQTKKLWPYITHKRLNVYHLNPQVAVHGYYNTYDTFCGWFNVKIFIYNIILETHSFHVDIMSWAWFYKGRIHLKCLLTPNI